MYTGVADTPTAAVAGAERGLSVSLTGQGKTAVGRCSKILLPVLFSFSLPYEPGGRPLV